MYTYECNALRRWGFVFFFFYPREKLEFGYPSRPGLRRTRRNRQRRRTGLYLFLYNNNIISKTGRPEDVIPDRRAFAYTWRWRRWCRWLCRCGFLFVFGRRCSVRRRRNNNVAYKIIIIIITITLIIIINEK